MARMMKRYGISGAIGEPHEETLLCQHYDCKPVEEPKREGPQRRMMEPEQWRGFQNGHHIGEHDELPGCVVEPKCTPVDEGNTMEFEIETWYTAPRAWTYRVKVKSSGYAVRDDGYPTRQSAKRAAEERADTLAKESLKPETYTYQGKLT